MVARKKFLLASGTILIFLITAGAACGLSLKTSALDGGVFQSVDDGQNWTQKVLVPTTSGAPQSIAGVNILTLVLDPEDNRAIYLGTEGDGLFLSYNGAESWLQADGMNRGAINAVAVDPKTKCTIYAGATNLIFKSTDCSRSWVNIYVDSRSNAVVTAIAVDNYNPAIVYAGLSSGDFIKSDNFGQTWNTIQRLDNKITKILIDKFDSRIVYIATQNKGIFRTTDRGSTWGDLNKDLGKYSGSFEFMNLIQDQTSPNSLFLVSKYGWLKTSDGGSSWQPLTLLTPPGSTVIYASAVNPKNNKEIFYSTETTLYHTRDGGVTWETKKLPTSRIANYLLIDPVNTNTIYLGTRALKK